MADEFFKRETMCDCNDSPGRVAEHRLSRTGHSWCAIATGRREVHRPRRGTSALLLCAITAILLVLIASSQHRIESLTIVSHAGKARTMTPVHQARVTPRPRTAARAH